MKTEEQPPLPKKFKMYSLILLCLLGFIILLYFFSPENAVQAQKILVAQALAPAPRAPAPAAQALAPAPRAPAPAAPAPAVPAPWVPVPAASKYVPVPALIPPKPIGVIMLALPFNVEINKPFNMEVWFEPSNDKFSGKIEVFMDETDGTVKYKPRKLNLTPNSHKIVEARIIKSNSGLATVIAYGAFKLLEPRCITIATGFSARLQARNLDRPVESGTHKSLTLDFIDKEGKPISLDAPVKLTLQSANTFFKQSDGSWANKIEFSMQKGQAATPAIEIKPKSLTMDVGMIMAEVEINYNNVVHNQNILFTISPPGWLSLLMAIIGGILHGIYQTTRAINEQNGPLFKRIVKTGFPRIACGALAGLLSFLFLDWNIIGIKIDTTSLKGFVILGFLFSYVGIDLILKHILPKK